MAPHWQHTALGYSPPFTMLSPNSIPSLARQRDHSACRRDHPPLKVRKTRENLGQAAELYADIPPPCLHPPDLVDDCCYPGRRGAGTENLSSSSAHHLASASQSTSDFGDTSGCSTTLVSQSAEDFRLLISPPPLLQGKMARQKSISKRMLSKVRDGISSKSRSSNNVREESGLMRRISAKRKQPQMPTQAQSRGSSFEVSRISSGSEYEDDDLGLDAAAAQRSFTDSSIATESAGMVTPPSASARGKQALQASPTPLSPSQELTPRPPSARIGSASYTSDASSNLSVTVPFIDLKVTVDRESVDVGIAHDVWVAVDATVRTQVMESATPHKLRSAPTDAIIVLCQDTLAEMPNVTRSCVIELLSRLDASDRMAVVVAHEDECSQLLSLQSAKTTLVLERLGFAPSMMNDSRSTKRLGKAWQPLHKMLKSITKQGVRNQHVFAISKTPEDVVQRVRHLVSWPAHAFKIGFGPSPTAVLAPHDWCIAFTGPEDGSNELLDIMIRDLRHGCPMGGIPSLRLCYKPMEQCRIVEVLGRKAVKDLKLGQKCSLFLKVHVPRMNTSQRSSVDDSVGGSDADSLLTELESIVGTLETDFLHVEARFRHAALPNENVVTLRHICSILRPKTDSRWSVSIPAPTPGVVRQGIVPVKLAQYIASNYEPAKALQMLDRWRLQRHTHTSSEAMRSVREYLEKSNGRGEPHGGSKDERQDSGATAAIPGSDNKPEVVITDIDSLGSQYSDQEQQPLPEVPPLSG